MALIALKFSIIQTKIKMAKIKITATSIAEYKEIEESLKGLHYKTIKDVVSAKKTALGITILLNDNVQIINLKEDEKAKFMSLSIRNQEVTIITEDYCLVRPMREVTTDHIGLVFCPLDGA